MSIALQNNGPDTLQNLDVKAGDVVQYIGDIENLWPPTVSTIQGWEGGNCYKEGDTMGGSVSYRDGPYFIIISRAKPKTWGKLTDAEQDKIAGHYARGGEVEWWSVNGFWVLDDTPSWGTYDQYRIKHTPVVETVTVRVWYDGYANDASMQTKDGVPQWDTLTGGDV